MFPGTCGFAVPRNVESGFNISMTTLKTIKHRAVTGGPDLADVHPVLARVYAARQVKTADELDLSLKTLIGFQHLMGIDAATALLTNALDEGSRILIVGDFDADGATSCALMVRGLRAMGAAHVDYLVPDRFRFGYGLTPEIVEVAHQREPDLVITVDNGIASIAGVAAARVAGYKVLVTDHHLPGETLPAADAIVNPNQEGDQFACKSLAGVGVAFYLLMALRARLRETGWFDRVGRAVPNLAQWLDLVALGTVADVVPLERTNRVLVAQGLARIRAGQACPGINALLAVAGRDTSRTVASDLGFAVGPRLNAAGRLDDMTVGIECLLCDDAASAGQRADQLDALNTERRKIETRMQAEAVALLADVKFNESDETPPAALCLFDPDWHPGVVGLLASRIKERVHRPVIAFARESETTVKGSARSIPGVHIRDVLDAVATRHSGLINKFGGHAMAAGLSLREADLDAFRDAFQQEVGHQIETLDLDGVLYSDGELQREEFNLDLAMQLRYAGPWGQAFPEPLFDGRFALSNWRVVGERHLKLVVRLPGSDENLDAIAFNCAPDPAFAVDTKLRLAYRLDANYFQGQTRLQLQVEQLQVLADN